MQENEQNRKVACNFHLCKMLELVFLASIDSDEVLPNQKKSHQKEKNSAHESGYETHTHASIFSPIFDPKSIVSGEVEALEGISDHKSRKAFKELKVEVEESL